MRILIIAITLILLSTSSYCEKRVEANSGFKLSYKYPYGKSLKYKKITNSDDEKFVSFIQIQAIDSSPQGDIHFIYKLDSCAFYNQNSLRRQKTRKELEYAQIQVTYTKNGKLLERRYIDDTKKDYSINSDYSDNENLFELPLKNISFENNWKTTRKYYDGLQTTKIKQIENKLIRIEGKSNHLCYRIEFRGTDTEITKQDDYTQTDTGTIVGTYWIDKESKIIIAVESETVFDGTKGKHPGLSPFAGLKLISRAPIKMTFEIIE